MKRGHEAVLTAAVLLAFCAPEHATLGRVCGRASCPGASGMLHTTSAMPPPNSFRCAARCAERLRLRGGWDDDAADLDAVEADFEAAMRDAGAAVDAPAASLTPAVGAQHAGGRDMDSDVEAISEGEVGAAPTAEAVGAEDDKLGDTVEADFEAAMRAIGGRSADDGAAAEHTSAEPGNRKRPIGEISLGSGAGEPADPLPTLNDALGLSATGSDGDDEENLPQPRPPSDLPSEAELPVGSDDAIPSSFLQTLQTADADIAQHAQRHDKTSALDSRASDEDDEDKNPTPRADFLAAAGDEFVTAARLALFKAAHGGAPDAHKKLRAAVKDGAPINSHNQQTHGWTALHMAAENGTVKAVETLIELGANLTSRSSNGHTPLHVAALGKRMPVMKVLLKHGADVDALTKALYSPLHVVASTGSMQMMHELLAWGADVHQRTAVGNTALHLAATQGHDHIVRLLLKNGLSANAENSQKYTPLHHAALRDCVTVMKVLVAEGADVNATTDVGNTAMHLAAVCGHVDAVEYMCDKTQYDFWLKNAFNLTALDAATYAAEGLCATALWRKMGKPGGRLSLPKKPLNESEEDEVFLQTLWDTYCEHRTEAHLPGVKKCDDIVEQMKAIKKLNGMPDGEVKPEDDFVVRKGIRVYLKDSQKRKKPTRLLMYDRGETG